jgi:hypothetical protein
MTSKATALFGLAAVMATATPSWAYEGGTTHAGMTSEAALASGIHAFLRGSLGRALGLFTPLDLEKRSLDRRSYRRLRRKLWRMDPSGGYRPDPKQGQRAIGWLMAGSVLAEMPASENRNHFYDPSRKKGLDDDRAFLGGLLALAALFEGGDTVRQFLTGTGFDLTGESAIDRCFSADSSLSVPAYFQHLTAAVTGGTSEERDHHLVMAMIALGGVLHLLQDMASPTHVRNDFATGHTQKLGKSFFYRGALYERFVARTFGRLGLPSYTGQPVRRDTIREYFSSKEWTGLADLTNVSHFSPGTLPQPVTVLQNSDAKEIRSRLSARLPFSKPALPPIDLDCARRRICHARGPHGPLLAYRVDPRRRQLVFRLDRTCLLATARHLLPLAIGYSTGLIDHLTRGRVSLELAGNKVRLRNEGVALTGARVHLLWEDDKGQRTPAKELKVNLTAEKGANLAETTLERPERARRLVALVDGEDRKGERVLTAGFVDIPGPPLSRPADSVE